MARWRLISILISISTVSILTGCGGGAAKPAAAPPSPPPSSPAGREAAVLGAYEGTLPCADCQGIRTELTFQSNGAFELRETYLGAPGGERTVTTRGRWALLRGTDQNRDAKIYRLTPRPTGDVRYFREVDDIHLRTLDRDQREIVSGPDSGVNPGINYTLTRR